MKKPFLIALLFVAFSVQAVQGQSHQAFDAGEWFRFRIHYGMFNASYATLEVKEDVLFNEPVYHVVGKGKSTGLLHLFFKVNDNYETYFKKADGSPMRFIRQIDEGGHTKNIQIDFDHTSKKAHVFNKKHNKRGTYDVGEDVQDMLSSFYYLRNNLDIDNLQEGDVYRMNMFFDEENHDFKLKFLGREVIKTKIGNIAALKFKPYVLAGRVFKEKESLTVWVSDDRNRIPLKIKADLAVGSLDADIDAFKGLKYPLNIIME